MIVINGLVMQFGRGGCGGAGVAKGCPRTIPVLQIKSGGSPEPADHRETS